MVLALIKLAVADPDNAARQLESKWGPQLSPEERNWVWGVIGKQAAQASAQRRAGLLRQGHRDSDLTDDMLAWKARAALRAVRGTQWPAVLQAINAMSEDAQPRSDLGLLEGPRAAGPRRRRPPRPRPSALLESRSHRPRGFYEQLALEELGQQGHRAAARRRRSTPEEKDAARSNPGLNRGALRDRAGHAPRRHARVELRHQPARTGGMGDRELLAAAQTRLRARGLGPLHQHQRAHQGRDRRRAALPDALPRHRWCGAAARSASTRPTSTA